MSEPVTNAEIEDVLSSIRRLISDNPGNGLREAMDGASNDKLVLTPAFRVLDGDRGAPGAAGAATAETPAPEAPEPKAPAPEAPEPEAPEPNASQADGAQAGAAEADAQDHNPKNEATPPPETGAQKADEPDASGSALEHRIAELEAAIGESFEEWEPDGSEAPEEGGEPIILHHVPTEPAEAMVEQFPQADEIIAEPDFSAAGMVLEAEEVFSDEAADEDMPAADDLAADDLAADDLVVDEEALRDMVAQLVREQLQGQIGEKITRSIRRMVRREIRLALSVRDIE